MAELAEAAAFDLEGAGVAAFASGAGSEASVPCWFCGDASFSLCVFDEDGGVCAGAMLVLLAVTFVLLWKSKSREVIWGVEFLLAANFLSLPAE